MKTALSEKKFQDPSFNIFLQNRILEQTKLAK